MPVKLRGRRKEELPALTLAPSVSAASSLPALTRRPEQAVAVAVMPANLFAQKERKRERERERERMNERQLVLQYDY